MSVIPYFLDRTWRPEDIAVNEVGYYSVYRDPLNRDDLNIREDRSALRKVIAHYEPDTTVPFHHAFQPAPAAEPDELSARPNRLEQMSCLNKWLELQVKKFDKQTLGNQAEFVTTNRVLSQIMKIPYGVDWHNTNEWAFGAARLQGKIYIGYIRRNGFEDLSKSVPGKEQQRQDNTWRKSSNRKHQFDEISYGPTSSPSGQFHSVVHTKFGGLRLLIDSTIDAEDEHAPDFPEYPGKYISLQLVPSYWRTNRQHSIWSRMCRWWTTDILNGVGIIRMGINGDHNGANTDALQEIKTYRIKDLPERVDDPENHSSCAYPLNCDYQRRKWNPHVCLSFLHLVLRLVKEKVVHNSTTTVYEFHGTRHLLNFTRIGDLNSVIVREVPAEEARDLGHNYLPY